MQVKISEEQIMEIAKKVAYSEVSSILSNRIDEVMTDDTISDIVKEAVTNYIEHGEGMDKIRESFIEEYIKEGRWYEYWDIGDAVDIGTSKLIGKVMKSLVFDPKKFKEVCAVEE